MNQMEVGIEDCLHIEFEYDRGAYGMDDTVLGRIHFLLVRACCVHVCSGPGGWVGVPPAARANLLPACSLQGRVKLEHEELEIHRPRAARCPHVTPPTHQ